MKRSKKATVVGSGPNGLAAAICLAEAGWSVRVVEMHDTIGGGTRTSELTLPGFHHDICSAVHPMALWSPFLSRLPLHEFGLEWVHPDYPVAQTVSESSAIVLPQSLEEAIDSFDGDGKRYRRLLEPLVRRADTLAANLLSPLSIPPNPILMTAFATRAVLPCSWLVRMFRSEGLKMLFAGNAAHSILPLTQPFTSAVGLLMLVAAHAVGWPMPRGGSHRITTAMAQYLRSLGGEIETGVTVRSLRDLPDDEIKIFDVGPKQLAAIAGEAFSDRYRTKLRRYRYGPGAYKVDWALAAPIPWTAEACRRAGTVHVAGNMAELLEWEAGSWTNRTSGRPFLLVAQQSVFDRTRAPDNCHTGWAYCHVPSGCESDLTNKIESQIERFAPGFKRSILRRHVTTPRDLERYNPNCVGGDIIGGSQDWRQLFSRPISALSPYRTERDDVFMCSASTPPGAGVHGMCGYHAAQAVLSRS